MADPGPSRPHSVDPSSDFLSPTSHWNYRSWHYSCFFWHYDRHIGDSRGLSSNNCFNIDYRCFYCYIIHSWKLDSIFHFSRESGRCWGKNSEWILAFFGEILVVHLGYFNGYASRPRSFNYADLLETHFPGSLISNVGFCMRECILTLI